MTDKQIALKTVLEFHGFKNLQQPKDTINKFNGIKYGRIYYGLQYMPLNFILNESVSYFTGDFKIMWDFSEEI